MRPLSLSMCIVLVGCSEYSPFDARRCRDGSFTGYVMDQVPGDTWKYSLDLYGDESNLDKIRPYVAALREMEGCTSITGNIRTDASGDSLLALHALEELHADPELTIKLDMYSHITPFYGRLEIGASASSTSLEGLASLRQAHTIQMYGSGIEDLTPLSSLERIDGALCLSQTSVPTLSPLADLRGVRRVGLADNPQLKDISVVTQFGALHGLGLTKLPSLSNLQQLVGLTAVSELFITQNPNLESLSGLEDTYFGLHESIDDGYFWYDGAPHLYIAGNPKLTDISALSSIQGPVHDLQILDNAQLTDLTPLYGITRINTRLEIGGGALTCEIIRDFIQAVGINNIGQDQANHGYARVRLCGVGLEPTCMSGWDVTYTGEPCFCSGCEPARLDCYYD